MELNTLKRILQINNDEERAALLRFINNEKNELMISKSRDDLVLHAILNFLSIYYPINNEWKNKYIEEFTNSLILFYDRNKKEISQSILKLMETTFKAPSCFKVLTNFEEKINPEKIHIECCLKLVLLTKNLECLLSGIKTYLLMDNEFLKIKLEKIDFESPYAQILIRKIVEKLINFNGEINNKDIENIFVEQVIEVKKYIKFLCPQCLQVQYIRYFKNKFQIICPNFHDYSDKINNINKLKLLSNIYLKCNTCNKKIEMFENNYYCLRCENAFCPNCLENHKNVCVKFVICKIYEVGFNCREHNKKYISICCNRECEKNMCETCKYNHYHKLLDRDLYNSKSIVNQYKSIVKNENGDNIKKYILKQLIFIYEFLENYYMIPLLFIQSLHFSVYDLDIAINESEFFFNEFFNNDFIVYYSKLIERMNNGNMNAIDILENIEDKYNEKNIKINEKYYSRYSKALKKVMSSNSVKVMHFSILNGYMNTLTENIKDNILKYGYVSTIENSINNLGIKNELYKSKIISLFQTNRRYKESLKLLFDRHFADIILKKLIKHYASNFETIEIDPKIAHDIISYLNKKNKNSKYLERIQKINENLEYHSLNKIEENKNNENEIYEEDDETKDKIKFKQGMKIGSTLISKNELNFILEFCFYFKQSGNEIAHPDIAPEKSVQLKSEEEKIEIIDKIINSEYSNEIKNITLEEEIKKKIRAKLLLIKEEIMKNFMELSTKKEIELSEVFRFMFFGEMNNIWLGQSAFLRTFQADIDKIINEEYVLDLSTYASDIQKIKISKDIIKQLESQNIVKNFCLDTDTNEYVNLKQLVINGFKKKIENGGNNKVIKSLQNINYSLLIGSIYNSTINNNFSQVYSEHEYMELIYSIAIPLIIEIENNNCKILEDNIRNKFIDSIITLNVKNKMEKIYQVVENYYNKNNINENYIDEVKEFCASKKCDGYKDLIKLEINNDSLFNLLNLLIGSEKINWLERKKKKEKFSLQTLLYYYQNLK